MSKILFADSGSTKTHWAYVECQPGMPKVIRTAVTQGLNPIHVSADEIAAALRQVLNEVGAGSVSMPDEIRFYGSGCTPVQIPEVERALVSVLWPLCQATGCILPHITVQSDLMGAALALAKSADHQPFIAGIMGTGSIASLFDPVTQSLTPMPALGYILGDEGSGAWFGRHLLGDYLKQQIPARAREAFEDDYGVLSAQSAIQHVYQQPCPNRYLATFAAFLGRHLEISYCQELAFRGCEQFFVRNVEPIDRLDKGEGIMDVRMVGSVAWHLQPILSKVAEMHGYVLTHVIKDPIEGLI